MTRKEWLTSCLATALSFSFGAGLVLLSPIKIPSLYWPVLKFKVRNLPIIKEGKCINVFRLANQSPEVERNTEFLAQDYPRLFGSDVPYTDILNWETRQPWSLYKFASLHQAPGGYLIARIYEFRPFLPEVSEQTVRHTVILHVVVYNKGFWGRYRQVERCRKHTG